MKVILLILKEVDTLCIFKTLHYELFITILLLLGSGPICFVISMNHMYYQLGLLTVYFNLLSAISPRNTGHLSEINLYWNYSHTSHTWNNSSGRLPNKTKWKMIKTHHQLLNALNQICWLKNRKGNKQCACV